MTAPLFAVPVVGLAWHADAACRRLVAAGAEEASTWDADVDGEDELDRELRLVVACATCEACPVAQACLDEYLAGRSTGGGVRAGYLFPDTVADLDVVDADLVARGTTRKRGPYGRPVECGTPEAARRHRARRELPLDEACQAAERAYAAERQRARRQRLRGEELVDA